MVCCSGHCRSWKRSCRRRGGRELRLRHCRGGARAAASYRRLVNADDAQARRLASYLTWSARILGAAIFLNITHKAVGAPCRQRSRPVRCCRTDRAFDIVSVIAAAARRDQCGSPLGALPGWVLVAAIGAALVTGPSAFPRSSPDVHCFVDDGWRVPPRHQADRCGRRRYVERRFRTQPANGATSVCRHAASSSSPRCGGAVQDLPRLAGAFSRVWALGISPPTSLRSCRTQCSESGSAISASLSTPSSAQWCCC